MGCLISDNYTCPSPRFCPFHHLAMRRHRSQMRRQRFTQLARLHCWTKTLTNWFDARNLCDWDVLAHQILLHMGSSTRLKFLDEQPPCRLRGRSPERKWQKSVWCRTDPYSGRTGLPVMDALGEVRKWETEWTLPTVAFFDPEEGVDAPADLLRLKCLIEVVNAEPMIFVGLERSDRDMLAEYWRYGNGGKGRMPVPKMLKKSGIIGKMQKQDKMEDEEKRSSKKCEEMEDQLEALRKHAVYMKEMHRRQSGPAWGLYSRHPREQRQPTTQASWSDGNSIRDFAYIAPIAQHLPNIDLAADKTFPPCPKVAYNGRHRATQTSRLFARRFPDKVTFEEVVDEEFHNGSTAESMKGYPSPRYGFSANVMASAAAFKHNQPRRREDEERPDSGFEPGASI